MGGEPSSRLAPAARAGAGIDVVIVAHRTRELLRSCLESLRAAGPGAVARVFVVDNDSHDGTVEMVRSAFPWVDVIPSERNLGFGAATNLAIARGSSPFVLVLNPDTRLVPGSLDPLLQVMDDHPEVGICGCRLVRDDGSLDHAARRSFPTIAGALGHFLLVGRSRFAPHALAQYRAPRVAAGPVDAVNGAFMLIRRTALERVGTFDEGFWMYMEDLDLCFRFKEAGWTTWYEPSVDAAHVKGGSSGRIRNPRLDYAFHYGMFRFYRKHYAPRSNPVVNAVVYLGIGAKLLVSLIRNAVRVSVARADVTSRRSSWGSPPWSLRVRMVRSFTRTRVGYRLKRIARRGQRVLRSTTARNESRSRVFERPTRSVRNLLLVSHADLAVGSGLHVSAIAAGLTERGFFPVVAVPSNSRGRGCPFPIVSHRDVLAGRLEFPDGGRADLVHAFSPRAAVRRVVRATRCAYVVHLEDDDANLIDGTRAAERDEFVADSSGVSVVIERLFELKPVELPGIVAWPGFDEAILAPVRSRDEVRRALAVSPDEIVLFYNGNVHETNLADMRELYLAVGLLRANGLPVVLVRSGWDFVPPSFLPRLGGFIRHLGWVERRHIPDLLHAADVLVQPGAPGPFNDFRFPSKLPEFLASGRPVVLPRTNIGLELRNGEEAMLLESGRAQEIAEGVSELVADPVARDRIGAGGRAFANRELRWSTTVDRLCELYARVGETTSKVRSTLANETGFRERG